MKVSLIPVLATLSTTVIAGGLFGNKQTTDCAWDNLDKYDPSDLYVRLPSGFEGLLNKIDTGEHPWNVREHLQLIDQNIDNAHQCRHHGHKCTKAFYRYISKENLEKAKEALTVALCRREGGTKAVCGKFDKEAVEIVNEFYVSG